MFEICRTTTPPCPGLSDQLPGLRGLAVRMTGGTGCQGHPEPSQPPRPPPHLHPVLWTRCPDTPGILLPSPKALPPTAPGWLLLGLQASASDLPQRCRPGHRPATRPLPQPGSSVFPAERSVLLCLRVTPTSSPGTFCSGLFPGVRAGAWQEAAGHKPVCRDHPRGRPPALPAAAAADRPELSTLRGEPLGIPTRKEPGSSFAC